MKFPYTEKNCIHFITNHNKHMVLVQKKPRRATLRVRWIQKA